MRWRFKAEAGPPSPVITLVGALRQLADDPDQVEGGLRSALRDAARVMEKQDALVEAMRRAHWRWARRFGLLTAMWLVLLALQIANLFHLL